MGRFGARAQHSHDSVRQVHRLPNRSAVMSGPFRQIRHLVEAEVEPLVAPLSAFVTLSSCCPLIISPRNLGQWGNDVLQTIQNILAQHTGCAFERRRNFCVWAWSADGCSSTYFYTG